jgi:hypothetical protein
MEKIFKPLMLVIGLILVILMVVNFFFVNSKLKTAQNKLEESQTKIDQAIKQLDYSKTKIDSIRNYLTNFGSYVQDVQGRVEIMDLERRLNDSKFVTKRDSIRNRLKELYPDNPIANEDLPDISKEK